jgi:type IV pilus assembly protein PilC
MAEFVWEARARTGELRKGTMEADSEEAVRERLRTMQLQATKVARSFSLPQIKFGSGVDSKDLVTFTRLFATMIDAGLPIVQCLDILAGQTKNPVFAEILRDVKESVEQGSTFSDALKRHPKVFDTLYTNLVAAGELGGILDTILNRLAVYIEKNVKLVRQVRGALFYPSAVMVIFVGVLGVLLGFVIPSFKKMFAEFGSADDLPAITQMVISVSEGFVNNLFLITSVSALLIGTFVSFVRTPFGKRKFHRFLLNAPVVGSVLQKIAVARFTRTLGTLLSAGVPILDALDVVAKTAGNVVIEEALYYTRARIAEGKTMAGPLMEAKVFPTMVVQMVGVGEQTGALDAMLNKIADFYEDEVDVAIASLTSLIEPVLMASIGGVVGVVLIAMYMPIFGLAGKIKAG